MEDDLSERFSMFDAAAPMKACLYDRRNGRVEFVLSRPEAIARAKQILEEEKAG